jgi:hypothetical protein
MFSQGFGIVLDVVQPIGLRKRLWLTLIGLASLQQRLLSQLRRPRATIANG